MGETMNMPDCSCGKQSTTIVRDIDEESIEYVCDKCFRELFPWNREGD